MSDGGTPAIIGCACGVGHMEVPMVDVGCVCSPVLGVNPDCDHAEFLVPAVCVKHKRHEPCRSCMIEEAESE